MVVVIVPIAQGEHRPWTAGLPCCHSSLTRFFFTPSSWRIGDTPGRLEQAK